MDGIIGLGYPNQLFSKELKSKSFLQNIFQKKVLKSNIFTLNLGKVKMPFMIVALI